MIVVLDEIYRLPSAGRFPASCDLRFYQSGQTDRAAFARLIGDATVIGAARATTFAFDRDLIEGATRLQFVQKSGSGTDWFDDDAMTEQGILLAVNRGFNAVSVAEHTVLLILMCTRNSFKSIDALRRGEWRRDGVATEASLLSGKVVGIIGMGAIGSLVARAMQGLGTEVIAARRHEDREPPVLDGIRWVSLDTLLRESDVVTLHMPHTPETDRLIGARELAAMKPGAVLINTARGRVVDEAALYRALRDGKLRAAGLDVFEQEPTPSDNPLLKLENVFATPHIGGGAAELEERQVAGTLANIERFLAGKRPDRLVNPEVLGSSVARATHLTT